MSAIKTYDYKGTTYQYTLTLKAKSELEKWQKAHTQTLANNPQYASVLQEYMQTENELEQVKKGEDKQAIKEAEQKLIEKQIALIPMTSSMDMDSFDSMQYIMFVLLKNHKDYKDMMTRELSDEIIYDMEENLGTEETWNFIVEIRDKVFTQIEKMNKALNGA